MSLAVVTAEVAMRRALELARRGLGFVEPNPPVGAVVVADDGRVLGEGWHERFGGPHAEVMALAAAGEAARGATLFVTLEPCCHFGKTPPCTRAVIAAGIRRVVVATVDPAAHANGGGIAELRAIGIEVEVGLMADDARRLVAPFARLTTTGLPWIHAKWAMTLDGKIASKTGSSRWITNEASRAVVHQLRGRMDAILVGVGTILADDPLLMARPPGPRTPIRIVLDSTARTPLKSQLVRTARDVRTVVVATQHAPEDRCAALRAAGVEVLVISEDSASHPDLQVRLSREFTAANYNVKQLIRWIVSSEAYALSSQYGDRNAIDDPAAGEIPLFSHMYLKSMQAEQMYDSLIVASNAHQAGKGGWSAQETQRRQWMQQFVVAFENDENDESTTFNGTIPQALMMMNSELMEKACSVERALADASGLRPI